MTSDELARLQTLLEAAEWVFAKTMPKNPHHYTLRWTWPSDEDFVWAVVTLRRLGEVERWWRKDYIVINLNGYKYWTMGAPIGPAPYDRQRDTILINRKCTTPPSTPCPTPPGGASSPTATA